MTANVKVKKAASSIGIGGAIARRLSELDLSASAAGRAASPPIPRARMAAYLRNAQHPNSKALMSLAPVLQCTVEELEADANSPRPSAESGRTNPNLRDFLRENVMGLPPEPTVGHNNPPSRADELLDAAVATCANLAEKEANLVAPERALEVAAGWVVGPNSFGHQALVAKEAHKAAGGKAAEFDRILSERVGYGLAALRSVLTIHAWLRKQAEASGKTDIEVFRETFGAYCAARKRPPVGPGALHDIYNTRAFRDAYMPNREDAGAQRRMSPEAWGRSVVVAARNEISPPWAKIILAAAKNASPQPYWEDYALMVLIAAVAQGEISKLPKNGTSEHKALVSALATRSPKLSEMLAVDPR